MALAVIRILVQGHIPMPRLKLCQLLRLELGSQAKIDVLGAGAESIKDTLAFVVTVSHVIIGKLK